MLNLCSAIPRNVIIACFFHFFSSSLLSSFSFQLLICWNVIIYNSILYFWVPLLLFLWTNIMRKITHNKKPRHRTCNKETKLSFDFCKISFFLRLFKIIWNVKNPFKQKQNTSRLWSFLDCAWQSLTPTLVSIWTHPLTQLPTNPLTCPYFFV